MRRKCNGFSSASWGKGYEALLELRQSVGCEFGEPKTQKYEELTGKGRPNGFSKDKKWYGGSGLRFQGLGCMPMDPMPLSDSEAISHFATCDEAPLFRKQK